MRRWWAAQSLTERLILGLVVAGVALRLWHYFGARSLWVDEALVGASIMHRDWGGLLSPLENNQLAPIGWLFLTKAGYEMLGSIELGLRAPALVFSLAALAVFVPVTGRIVSGWAHVIVVGLYALSPRLIYFAAEAKPYGVDAAVTVLLLALAVRYLVDEAPLRPIELVGLSLAGVASVLLSFPAVFVLAALGLCLALRELLARRYLRLTHLAAVGASWLFAFAICYVTFYSGGGVDGAQGDVAEVMAEQWAESFLPFPPTSVAELQRYPISLVSRFELMFGDHSAVPVLIAAIFGGVHLGQRNRWLAGAVIAPFAILFLAAIFRFYPLGVRLVIFTLPLIVVLAGAGVALVLAQLKARAGAILAGAAFVALAYGSVTQLWGYFTYFDSPFSTTPLRQVLAEVAAKRAPGEPIYVDAGSLAPYDIYKEAVGLADAPMFTFGRGATLKCLAHQIDIVSRHRRVWVVYSHGEARMGMAPHDAFEYWAGSFGRRLDTVHQASAYAALYEFEPTSGASLLRSLLPADESDCLDSRRR